MCLCGFRSQKKLEFVSGEKNALSETHWLQEKLCAATLKMVCEKEGEEQERDSRQTWQREDRPAHAGTWHPKVVFVPSSPNIKTYENISFATKNENPIVTVAVVAENLFSSGWKVVWGKKSSQTSEP